MRIRGEGSSPHPGIILPRLRLALRDLENPGIVSRMSPPPLQIAREPLAPFSLSLPLALALQCWPEAERAMQLEALRQADAKGSSDFLLLAARRGDDLAGAILAQQLPGKTATLFSPQLVLGEADPSIPLQLLANAESSLAAAGVHLCQCLLAKGLPAAPLAAAGYQHSADLLYMTCEPDHFPAGPPAIPGFKLAPFKDGEEAALAIVIDETYVGTQDCPALNGLRDSLDVVEGYKHVGEFRADLWLTLESETNSAAGCLILAKHPPSSTLELIYVGVTPAFRQRGLGAKLTRHAQWLAGQSNCERLVLAVDAANEPAIAMYAGAGFWAWEERAIWVKSLA